MPISFIRYVVFTCALISTPLFGYADTAKTSGTPHALHIRGSTTLLEMAQHVAERYMLAFPQTTLALSGGGTSRGYKALLDGTAEIALASSRPTGEVGAAIQQQGLILDRKIVAYSAIVAVVNPQNTLSNLTVADLTNIFTGRITNWQYFGGANTPIHVYVGPPTGGITEAWKDAVIGENNTYTAQGVVLPTLARVQKVAADPLAITFIALSELDPSVKPLSLNHFAANTETVLDGRYPLRAPLMLVTRHPTSPAAQNFIDYFLRVNPTIALSGIIPVTPKMGAKP